MIKIISIFLIGAGIVFAFLTVGVVAGSNHMGSRLRSPDIVRVMGMQFDHAGLSPEVRGILEQEIRKNVDQGAQAYDLLMDVVIMQIVSCLLLILGGGILWTISSKRNSRSNKSAQAIP